MKKKKTKQTKEKQGKKNPVSEYFSFRVIYFEIVNRDMLTTPNGWFAVSRNQK